VANEAAYVRIGAMAEKLPLISAAIERSEMSYCRHKDKFRPQWNVRASADNVS
jgi:hypothetical protein